MAGSLSLSSWLSDLLEYLLTGVMYHHRCCENANYRTCISVPENLKEWAQETPQQDDDIILYFEIDNSGGRQNPSKSLTWTASK